MPSRTTPGASRVPVLWDKERATIVNNEFAEIIRMLNSAFDGVGAEGPDFYPAPLRAEIDRVNARVYDTVNNGVYKAGFARRQAAYEEAVTALFATLDALEEHLDGSATWRATGSPTPTSGCSRRSSASIRSTSATSSATSSGWSTIPIYGPLRASSISCRGSPRRSTSTTSSTTTTAATPR